MENANVSPKDTNLVSVLETHFMGKLNLARIKFISLFIIALTKVRTVSFENLARAFDAQSEESSSLCRIQRFISSYSLDSDSQERINLIERYIKLFEIDTIDCIVADREFVGGEWLKYLNDNKLRYYILTRNNFIVFVPRKNETVKASWLFSAFRINEFVYYPNIVKVNGQLCYLSGSKLNKGGYLILVSFNKPEKADFYYKQRWQSRSLGRNDF